MPPQRSAREAAAKSGYGVLKADVYIIAAPEIVKEMVQCVRKDDTKRWGMEKPRNFVGDNQHQVKLSLNSLHSKFSPVIEEKRNIM